MDFKSFKKSLKEASEVVLLNETSMRSIAQNATALKPGLLILALSCLLESFGHYFFPSPGIIVYRPDLFTVLWTASKSFLFALVALYLVGYVVQEFFRGHIKMDEFVRVMLFGFLIGFIDIVPSLDIISKIWIVVILLTVLRKLAKLDWDAVGILALIMFAVSLVL